MHFELSDEILRVIDMGLQELPFKISAPVLSEINRQISEQQQKKAIDSDKESGQAHQEMLAMR